MRNAYSNLVPVEKRNGGFAHGFDLLRRKSFQMRQTIVGNLDARILFLNHHVHDRLDRDVAFLDGGRENGKHLVRRLVTGHCISQLQFRITQIEFDLLGKLATYHEHRTWNKICECSCLFGCS